MLSSSCTKTDFKIGVNPGDNASNLTESRGFEAVPRKVSALVVGIGHYYNGNYSVEYGDDDAADIAYQLRQVFGDENVHSLVNEEATKENIRKQIERQLSSENSEDDAFIFYFAGRGTALYISPFDSLATSFSNDINADELNQWLGNPKTSRTVVILDSCLGGNLAESLEKNRRVIISAGAPGETVWESTRLKHGVFSDYFIKAFANLSDVDKDGNHIVTIEEIFHYVSLGITNESNEVQLPSPQHPILWGDNNNIGLPLFTIPF